MSDVGDMLYDKDAVYININDHQVTYSQPEEKEGDVSGPKAGIFLSFPDRVCFWNGLKRTCLFAAYERAELHGADILIDRTYVCFSHYIVRLLLTS